MDEITASLAKSDVYSEAFASTVVVQMPTGTALVTPINLSSFEQHSLTNSNVHYSTFILTESLLPSGPYFAHDKGIYDAWRLYSDELDAFEIAVIPEAVHSPAKYCRDERLLLMRPWPADSHVSDFLHSTCWTRKAYGNALLCPADSMPGILSSILSQVHASASRTTFNSLA